LKRARLLLATFIMNVVAAVPAKGDDEAIKLLDCPAAVRKTLIEEAKGAAIEAVTREDEDGETTYRADVVIGGSS
jgi:hypothetical protein